MKTPLLIAAAVIAFGASASSMAQDDSSAELTLIGQVKAKCVVGDPARNTDLSFGTPGAATSATFSGISLKCNSANGVVVSLTSRNGALQAGNVNGVPYSAKLVASDVGLDLTLQANNSGNELRNSQDLRRDNAPLAAGTTATLTINVPSTPSFSGLYTDDLVISLVSGG